MIQLPIMINILFSLKPEQTWEALKIGAGVPPIKTEKGWLVIYHGVNAESRLQCWSNLT